MEKTVWITGASSGIGLALVKQYASSGHIVLGSSRTQPADTIFDTSSVHWLACDVTSLDDLQRTEQEIQKRFGFIDLCIINAGSCEYVDSLPVDTNQLRQLFEINFFAAVNTANSAMTLFPSGGGRLAVVSSQAIFAPFAKAQMYSASKAALSAFFNSFRVDAAKHNVAVTLLYPGFVKTPLTDKNQFTMPFLLSSDDAAQRMYRAIDKGKRHSIFPLRLALLLMLSKIFPNRWDKKMGKQKNAKN